MMGGWRPGWVALMLGAVGGLALLGNIGCQRTGPEEPASPPKPAVKKVVKPPETPGETLPGGFPEYAHMTFMDSVPFESGPAMGRRYVFEAVASERQIEDFYNTELRKAGWQRDNREVELLGDTMGMEWAKGNQRCGVLVIPGSGTSTVMILLAQLPEYEP